MKLVLSLQQKGPDTDRAKIAVHINEMRMLDQPFICLVGHDNEVKHIKGK
ncbi:MULTISPECIES: hypothetical protein [Acetobacter]|nr:MULTISPECIES: hypothetical protein [Acetobacter]KGB25827.1 hypothetical protein ApDm4_0769 [Acetobacter pomorum]